MMYGNDEARVSSNTHRVIAAPDCDLWRKERNPIPNAPEPDLKRWSVALVWYRSRPSGSRRSYTAPAPKLDLPFVGLEVVGVR